MSRSRDGLGVGAGCAKPAAQNCNTRRNPRWTDRNAGDRLTIHDIVISPRFRRRFFAVKHSDSSTNVARRLDQLTKIVSFPKCEVRDDFDLE
jgi:hypothetical protein